MEKIVEIQGDKIIFDKNFFNRAFVNSSIVLNKPLGSLSLRIMAILLQKMSTYKGRKLPSRTGLAKELNVSTTAINNSLIELEEAGFLIRIVSELENIVPVDEKDKELQEMLSFFEEQKEANRKAKRFSDLFKINYNFNQTKEEMSIEIYESIRKFLDPSLTNEELRELLEKLYLSEQIIEEVIKKHNN